MDKTNTLSIIPDRLTFVGDEGTFDGFINIPTLSLSEDSSRVASTSWAKLLFEPIITASTAFTYWRGDKTFQTLDTSVVPENGNLYFTNDRSIDSTLTGFLSSTGIITSADSILTALQKLYGNLTTDYFPYTGATGDANTSYNITAAKFITSGGTSSQFVKGDGSLDNAVYLTSVSGITAGGELAGTYPNPTLVNSAVLGKLLTGLTIAGSAILSTDNIITAFGKIQAQINGMAGGTIFQSSWNANTNTPTLVSSVGTKGYFYIVDTAGTTTLDGISTWNLGDWAIFDGTVWRRIVSSNLITSVNSATGAVVITVTGTTNRISVSGGTGITPTIDIAATYIGQSSITTVGTLTSGSIGAGFTAIANARLANSTISGVALGTNLNTLTIGTGLSGTGYNGSAPITITNAGVLSITSNAGLSANVAATGAVTITNTGVLSNVAGTGVSVSGATGNVTISIGQAVGTTANVTFNTVTATSGGFNSDRNDKFDIRYSPISDIFKLTGASYLRKSTGKSEYGYIAQDVLKFLPEAVYLTDKGLAVSYHMVNAARLDGIQNEIMVLKQRLAALENRR